MQQDILPYVIFSPADLALSLADGLHELNVDVTLFTPGPVTTTARNINADLSYFEAELNRRGDTYLALLKKHPFTFVTLARQVQGELIARAYAMANADELDVVHVYTNEEELALLFASLCTKPVVFTHHDPFNFLVKYKSLFPKYKHLNWISMSLAQRSSMPADTNWVANIYHGLTNPALKPATKPTNDYIAYVGRVIQPKGVHVAISALRHYNKNHPQRSLTLKIAGKHYGGHHKDTYWDSLIAPALKDPLIEYVGFINDDKTKQEFLANAKALIVPSLFDEPFGMVSIEAMACGTPVIGLDSGALPEVIADGLMGSIVKKVYQQDDELDEDATSQQLAAAIEGVAVINRSNCRADYEARFTAERMCAEHVAVYEKLIK